MNILSPRPYQNEAITELVDIFNKFPNDQRAFIVLPTGTGKTYLTFFFLLQYYENKNISVTWVCYQTNLVEQSKDSLIGFLEQKEIKFNVKENKDGTYSIKFLGISILFTTWQGLSIRKTQSDLLIIDEVHKGSSTPYGSKKITPEHLSFKTILPLAKAHIYISATPYDLNETLYPGCIYIATKRDGKKRQVINKDRRVEYTKNQAYKDGAIVNTQMVCIQTVDTLKLKEMDIDKSFNEMDEGAEYIKDQDIDIKADKSRVVLNRSMRESMLEVFCEKEIRNGKIQQTIIFAKSKADTTDMLTAETICKEVKKIVKVCSSALSVKLPTGKSLVRIVTSSEGDSDVDFEDFRKCKFPVLIVVGMAKEGFDAPKTEVAIDFNFNVKNIRDMEQKIGRLLRISDGKYVARYYYPDIFENYLKVNNKKVQCNDAGKKDIELAIDSLNSEIVIDSDVMTAVESAVRTQGLVLDNKLEGEVETDDKFKIDGVEIINHLKPNGELTKMIVTSTSLCLDDAYNNNPLNNLYVRGLFDKVEEVAGQNEDYSTIKKIREAFERLCL